ncbi:MAG: response regulator [Polyangiales bacterium]
MHNGATGEGGGSDRPTLLGRTLLLVEPDIVLAERWRQVTQRAGMHTEWADNVRTASQLLLGTAAARFDCALIENKLADGSGIELVPKLGALHSPPPFALVTDQRDDAQILACWEEDLALLPKPTGDAPLLDLLQRLIERRQTQQARSDTSAQRARVLLVADDPGVCTLLTQSLDGDDEYEVYLAKEGYEGLRLAAHHHPDVIVCDLGMRSFDGSQLLRILRARRETAAIPVIAMTSEFDDGTRTRALAEGADDFLIKPFAKPELLARVRNFTVMSRMRSLLGQHASSPPRQLEGMVEHVLVQKRHAVLLSDTSKVLGATLEYRDGIAEMLRLLVTSFADAALVDLFDRRGVPQPLALAHADPVQEVRLRELHGKLHAQSGKTYIHPLAPALKSGRTEWIQVEPDEPLSQLGIRCGVSTPLFARDRLFGAFTLLSCSAERPLSPADNYVAEDLARRMTMAIEHAELYREAKDAVAARDEFLSIASHELKTPLNPLVLQISSMQRKVAEFVVESERDRIWKKLDAIRVQAGKLTRLINDLLDVSRVTGGKVEYDLASLDLSEVVREVIQLFEQRDEVTRANCKLEVNLTDGLVGKWDRLRLDQIVTNLLSNALKYGAGSRIVVTTSRTDDRAELRVKDGGIGIAPEDHERVFERYERAVSFRHYGGLGLGLFIVRKLAEGMGGTVRVESSVLAGPDSGPTGTTFLLSMRL